MGFGLFGKLPQKRDFVSYGISRDVLGPLETWLQSAVAASRAELGSRWDDFYLVAPIWRFWIGPRILGAGCTGSLMPSVDGVGRYFPLMAIHVAETGQQSPPPPFAPQSKWHGQVEARLLSVLDEGVEIAPETLLAGLPSPSMEPCEPAAGITPFKGDSVWYGAPKTSAAVLLSGIVEADYREAARDRSYWWTAGAETTGPVVHARTGLPDPYFHTLMLRIMAE